MRRIILTADVLIALLVMAVFAYAGTGYIDARGHAADFKTRAAELTGAGTGASALSPEQLRILLLVEDPGFIRHRGLDLSNKGAGLTTITQSLSKRLAFEEFRPGLKKIRQTGYAIGLESSLTKEEILTLWLDTVEMGRDANGQWVTGFYRASEAFYGKPVEALSDAEFIELVSLPIAPGHLNPFHRGQDLDDRIQRIARRAAGDCKPESVRDVWLEGCAVQPDVSHLG
nr:transglycosylase domain-containing protein [uncultured Hyphomonas sp.]